MSQSTKTIFSCDICGSENEDENLVPLFGKSGARVDICYNCKSKPVSTVIMVIASTDGLVAERPALDPPRSAAEPSRPAAVVYTTGTEKAWDQDRDEAWQTQLDEIEKLAANIPTVLERGRFLQENGWRRSGNYWAPPGEEDGEVNRCGLASRSGTYTVPTAVREQLARERDDTWADRRGRYWHGVAQSGKSNW